VTGSGDSFLDFDVPFHFTIDARSGLGARDPSGTVTLDLRGVHAEGQVTCVRVKGPVAAVGVQMENPPPGISSRQLWFIADNYPVGNDLSVTPVETAPTTCPPPKGGSFQVSDSEITVRQADPDVIPSDTTPPVLRRLDALTVNATGPRGARVNYRAFAIDTQDAHPVLRCSPPKFALFPIGTTTVRCTATDASGNEASGSFPLTVKGARGQLHALGTYIVANGLPASLKARVDAALAAVRRGRRRSACRRLRAFSRQVRAQAGTGLTPVQAGRLSFDADRIRAVLRCVRPPRPATVPTIRLAPACDLTQPDLGTPGPYGATLTLEAFPPNATIDLQLVIEGFGRLPLLPTTDSEGRYGPISGSLPTPLGLITASASLDGVVLATASIDNPCVLEPRGGR
jgi:HYR domain